MFFRLWEKPEVHRGKPRMRREKHANSVQKDPTLGCDHRPPSCMAILLPTAPPVQPSLNIRKIKTFSGTSSPIISELCVGVEFTLFYCPLLSNVQVHYVSLTSLSNVFSLSKGTPKINDVIDRSLF